MDNAEKVILDAKAFMLTLPKSKACMKTKESYRRAAQKIFSVARSAEAFLTAAADTRKISTWRVRRAALVFGVRDLIERLLANQDKLQRSLHGVPGTDSRWSEWRTQVQGIAQWVPVLKVIRAAPSLPRAGRIPKKSKLQDIRGLPSDWRERVVRRLVKDRLAGLTTAVTGCRPEELLAEGAKEGVRLSIEGEHLIAHIVGAKTTDHAGQGWRRLRWPLTHPASLVQQLIAEVQAAGETVIAKIASKTAFTSSLRAAGKREWPLHRYPERKGRDITSYCFRHALASDMKNSGLSDADISAALGHRIDVTKETYGTRRIGSAGGGLAPASVKAEYAVKVKARSKRSVAFKAEKGLDKRAGGSQRGPRAKSL
ncbi:hypothetical protein [Lacisediminimonas sp.]|uniref:hypothetical protein n=1 Tax=Lacisediminimonas sp. TaxID=3060582 RepID=UPI002719E8A2|nr:hypothetical protein [Lacisediminimonas sp.]MDO8299220.1 hypothetical protein [Lacisediminimonas sp.]